MRKQPLDVPLEQPFQLSRRACVHAWLGRQPPPVPRLIRDTKLVVDACSYPLDLRHADRVYLVRGKIQAGVQPDQPRVTIRATGLLTDADPVASLARVRREVVQQPPIGCRQPPLHEMCDAVGQPPCLTRTEFEDPARYHQQCW